MASIISLYRIPEHIKTLADMPDNFALPPLGSNGEVVAILNEFFPQTEFPTRDWAEIRSDDVSGIYVLDTDPIYDVTLRDASPALVRRICQRTGWRAFDPADGSIIAS
jgi:hypothetical protein